MPHELSFLTANDVAETLKVDVRVVWGLLKTGDLRGIQVGGRGMWRIEERELEKYVARQYQRSAEAADREDRDAGTGPLNARSEPLPPTTEQ